MATWPGAQVMTRDIVKSRLIHESEWVIRSQPPFFFSYMGKGSSTIRWLAQA